MDEATVLTSAGKPWIIQMYVNAPNLAKDLPSDIDSMKWVNCVAF